MTAITGVDVLMGFVNVFQILQGILVRFRYVPKIVQTMDYAIIMPNAFVYLGSHLSIVQKNYVQVVAVIEEFVITP